MATNRITALNVNDALEARATFTPKAVTALRAFVRSKPWRGSVEERRAKFETLNTALAEAYGMEAPDIRPVMIDAGVKGNGAYGPEHNLIVMVGKLSVVTYLYCFGLARRMKRAKALTWARSCFQRFFPLSYSRCQLQGDLLVKIQ